MRFVAKTLLLAFPLVLFSPAGFSQGPPPLSVSDVEGLLRGGVGEAVIAKALQERGVNFELTAALRARLQRAGAGAAVMEAVAKASAEFVARRPAAPPVKTPADLERARLEEENKKLRERLEREEAKRKEDAQRAKLEEENRKLKEALRQAEEDKKRLDEAKQQEEERKRAEEARRQEQARREAEKAARASTGRDGAEMVSVPAGEFWMGSEDGDADEKPRRRVYLDAFRIDKFEVTNALYRRFMDATGRAAPRFWNDSRWNGSSQPVVGVDWNDAQAYCRWAGKRLPTEAEWEKVARGADGRTYPWGNQWDSSRANSDESKLGKTVAVGSYAAGVSPYGAHDMAGNVWEWVADWHDENYYRRAPDRNPKGPDSGQSRVLRGGSWNDYQGDLRSSNRDRIEPAFRDDIIGFRCAQ